MNKEQKLYELRKEEARLFRQKESLLKEKSLLENQIEDFERYCSDAQTQLWDSFETYPCSRIFLSSCSQRHSMSRV